MIDGLPAIGAAAVTVEDFISGDAGAPVLFDLVATAGKAVTGAALGVARTGGKAVLGFARRNPVIAVAAVAGAGLLWYAARRRAQQAEDGAIEGQSRRVAAKRANGSAGKPRGRTRANTSASAP